MNLMQLYEMLDFNEYNYLYHETDLGNGEDIISKGLYVDGNDIIGFDNVIYTTCARFPEECFKSAQNFIDFISFEQGIHAKDMVIIVSPKEYQNKIVEDFDNYVSGRYYQGIIRSEYILGYVDLDNLTFNANLDCMFGDMYTL